MKLRIIKYVHGKDRGCKEDVVWYIEHDDSIDHNKVWITCWPENGEAPYSVEGFDPRMVYYSEALANKAFEKIKKWYLTPTHITVREEEFEPWWKKKND